jgi:hypothetical protein
MSRTQAKTKAASVPITELPVTLIGVATPETPPEPSVAEPRYKRIYVNGRAKLVADNE